MASNGPGGEQTRPQVGQYLRQENEHFSWSRVEHKQEHDYVSYVDKTSEQMLVEALSELLPEAGFLTEEGTAAYDGQPYCWVIDPLDGTTNFMHRYAPFAYPWPVPPGEPGGRSGLRGEGRRMFLRLARRRSMAQRTAHQRQPPHAPGGSHWGGAPLQCSRLYATGLQLISRLYGRVSGLRMVGSAAVALAYVAAGRMEGGWNATSTPGTTWPEPCWWKKPADAPAPSAATALCRRT